MIQHSIKVMATHLSLQNPTAKQLQFGLWQLLSGWNKVAKSRSPAASRDAHQEERLRRLQMVNHPWNDLDSNNCTASCWLRVILG